MRAVLVLFGVWAALMVAAVGLGWWIHPGVGLLAGGVSTAAVLLFGVDVDPPVRERPAQRGSRDRVVRLDGKAI